MGDYKIKNVLLEDLYAQYKSPLQDHDRSNINLSDYNYKNPNVNKFVRGLEVPNNYVHRPYGWGRLAENNWYKYQGSPIPFATKESSPLRYSLGEGSWRESLDTVVYSTNTSVPYIELKYDSSLGYCVYKKSTAVPWVKVGSGFTGVFIILQGAGGGGGGAWAGEMYNYGAGSRGGYGGGGGAFIMAYLDLSSIPNEVVTLYTGKRGLAGQSAQSNTAGQDGGDSYLSYQGNKLLIAGGGKGGQKGDNTTMSDYGGQGGICTTSPANSYKWISVIAFVNGKDGGGITNYTPVGQSRSGNEGYSYSDNSWLTVTTHDIIDESVHLKRTTDPSYPGGPYNTYGIGGSPYPNATYESSGSGGGASPFSFRASTKSVLEGYGGGGGGGSAKVWVSGYTRTSVTYAYDYTQPANGLAALVGIMKCDRL